MLTDAITSLVSRYLDPHDLLAWLLLFMVFDVLTGVAASFREHRIDSSIAWKGMWKKVATALGALLIVIIEPFVRAYAAGYDPHLSLFAILGFISAEAFSIFENLGRCGVQTELLAKYLPKAAERALVDRAASTTTTIMTTTAPPISAPLTDEAVKQVVEAVERKLRETPAA